MKVINKELREIDIEEISNIGELFTLGLHESLESITDNTKEQYEIIDVIKKGYKLNGKVIRKALVVTVIRT